jgi:hypothetical protein
VCTPELQHFAELCADFGKLVKKLPLWHSLHADVVDCSRVTLHRVAEAKVVTLEAVM